jgi:hypothetical protein
LVTLKDLITKLDPDSLPAQALEGEQSQLISVVKSLSPYCNAISNILFRTRMITASLDMAPRKEYATDDDSSTKYRFRPNLANNKHHRHHRHHRHPLQSKAPMDHAPGLRTTTRAGPPTATTTKNKKTKRENTTASSTISKIDTQRNSKTTSRLSKPITTSHKKEHRDKTQNKGIKRLRSRPSNRSRSAGRKRKSSHSSNTSPSKRLLMSFPNVGLQFQKAIMQKMIQQEGLRQGSTSSTLFNIFSSIMQQGAMSEKIVNLEHQYIADPPRIFKALGYATGIVPIALAPASASINLHSIARRTIPPFLNIQQPSKEDTTSAGENETIFEDTTISKEQQQQQQQQQQQYVQPFRSTSSATAQKPAASKRKLDVQKEASRRRFKMSPDKIHTQAEKFTRQKSVPRKRYPVVDSESQVLIHMSHHHNVMKIPSRLGSAIAGFFGAGHIMRNNIRASSQVLSSPSMTVSSSSSTATTIANSRANLFEPLLKRGFLPLHNTLMASLPSVAAIVGGVGEGGEEATAHDRAAHDKARIVKSESSRVIREPFVPKTTPESIKGEDGNVTSLPSNEIAFQLPTHNILSKMLSRIISNVNVARADDDDDKSTGAELLPPIFLHKALFHNVMTSMEKISTRMAMPMQQRIASGVKGQAKEEPKQARVDDMVTAQASERLLYDEYGQENIQSAAAAYTALGSRVNHPLYFPFQLMSSTSIVTEGVKKVLANRIRSILQGQNTIIPSTILPSVVKDRFGEQKIPINPCYYTRQQMYGAFESTTPIGLSSFSEPAAKNAGRPDRRYLSHLYAKKEEDEEDTTRYEYKNRNLEIKELQKQKQKQKQQQQQQLVNPVTGLQREYSKYILQNAIYNAGKDQSILLTATRPSQSKPMLSTTKTITGMRERQADVRKSSSSSSRQYANMAKIDNTSVNLPVVSQLQVMLANQYAENSDHHINSLALLPHRQILSSPIPQAYVAQRLRTSFESTAGKQLSTISTNETNGKMLNERSSSTLTGEYTGSGFGQDNSGSRSSSSRYATKIEQEDTNKGISLRQLRKMMEQIFHEELKRYGL